MKVRLGFVSNSSSCSFTCPACSNKWEDWDWVEDPVCEECGCHISNVKKTFPEYLIEKYDLDMTEEIEAYIEEQKKIYKEEQRQEFIKEYGREPND